MSKTKTVHMSNGRSVENESIWKEKPPSPSPSLLYPCLLPHFYFRHFYLSTKLGLTDFFSLMRHWIIELSWMSPALRVRCEGVGGYFQTSFSIFSLKLFRIPKVLAFWYFEFFSSTFLLSNLVGRIFVINLLRKRSNPIGRNPIPLHLLGYYFYRNT